MYKIVIDSCGELTEELKADGHFVNVALEMEVNGYRVVDDETFNQKDFLKRVKEQVRRCGIEGLFEAVLGLGDVFAVTISSILSGSYNSAQLAKQLFEEEYGEGTKQIYIFNSRSASVGETLIGMKVQECETAGMSFEETVEQTEAYIAGQNTYFVLETLETLRKNGRLSNLKAFVANALNIKPVMGATPDGLICQLGQARGMHKALKKMVEEMLSGLKEPERKVLAISHCNCPERAHEVKEEVERSVRFQKIVVVDTAGISSMYANDGGVIMAV